MTGFQEKTPSRQVGEWMASSFLFSSTFILLDSSTRVFHARNVLFFFYTRAMAVKRKRRHCDEGCCVQGVVKKIRNEKEEDPRGTLFRVSALLRIPFEFPFLECSLFYVATRWNFIRLFFFSLIRVHTPEVYCKWLARSWVTVTFGYYSMVLGSAHSAVRSKIVEKCLKKCANLKMQLDEAPQVVLFQFAVPRFIKKDGNLWKDIM